MYVGPAECAKCDGAKVATQQKTPMARTSVPIADSDVLATHDRLILVAGRMNYSIATTAGGSLYTITDGTDS